jgi:glutamine amidotransferase
MPPITILDYGMGNLRSIANALASLGCEYRISSTLIGAEKLILPGVGAFGAAMQRLAPMADDVRAFARSGQPLLGVCLGQQLLFERSQEFGEHAGLGLLGGEVKFFPDLGQLKVPHVGWNSLEKTQSDGLLSGVQTDGQVYFVHSLVCEPSDPGVVAAKTTYGVPFAAAIQSGTIWAAQFHPEKSGPVGLGILQNFVSC